MDSIVQSIVTALSGKISKELIVFLVSMVPLLEYSCGRTYENEFLPIIHCRSTG